MKIDRRTLSNPIAEGGEGIIYKYRNQILKIFKPAVDLSEKLAKLEILINTPNLPSSAITPKEIVYSAAGDFIGYIMNDLSDIDEFGSLTNRKTLKSYGLKISGLTKMLVSLRNTIKQLHDKNIFIGDLNDSNVVFNSNFDTFILDTDSWSVGAYPCTVAMESFKDPKLIGTKFSEKTDAYAFAILVFKTLTRLHPFGGVTTPDLDLITRMQKGLSVLNPKTKAIIPKIIDPWDFMSPELIEFLHKIYDKNLREFLEKTLDDFSENLAMCKTHDNDYYSKFDKCPVCEDAKLKPEAPMQVISRGAFPYVLLFKRNGIQLLSEHEYLENKNIVHVETSKATPNRFGYKIYYFTDGTSIEISSEAITIDTQFTIPKLHNSTVTVHHDSSDVVFVTPGLMLSKLHYTKGGNSIENITRVTINAIFDHQDNHVFVCNISDANTLFYIDGAFSEALPAIKIKNYGIHRDAITGRWLFIFEHTGQYFTKVFDGAKIIYENDSLKYNVPLNSIAFYNNTIYTAHDKLIRGFNFRKNEYKDFECKVVTEGALLAFYGKQIHVINDTTIFKLG